MQFPTKKEYAYEQIKSDILSGLLAPDTKLVISELARKYEMSHIPVREALSQLFHEGLVHNIPYTGARVAHRDLEELLELTVVRTEMESLALRAAQPYRTGEQQQTARQLLGQLRVLFAAGNLPEYMQVNRAFYVSLFSGSPYEHLNSFVQESFHRSRINTALIAPGHIPESLEAHEGLLQAVEAGDMPEAVRRYRALKNLGLKAVLDVMEKAVRNPDRLAESTAAVFYTEQEVREHREELLQQIERCRTLIRSSEGIE